MLYFLSSACPDLSSVGLRSSEQTMKKGNNLSGHAVGDMAADKWAYRVGPGAGQNFTRSVTTKISCICHIRNEIWQHRLLEYVWLQLEIRTFLHSYQISKEKKKKKKKTAPGQLGIPVSANGSLSSFLLVTSSNAPSSLWG